MTTPHAPLGAAASFDFGPPGEPAGFRLASSPLSPQDVYVGCRPSAREPWSLLPFFTPRSGGPAPLPKGRFGRFIALSGDKWMIGPLVFKLCTPFETPAPSDEKLAYAPVVCGYLEYDNTHGTDTAELIFGLGSDSLDLRPAPTPGVGFILGDRFGFVTAATEEVTARRDAALFGAEVGPAAGLHFVVPPHSKRIFPLVLGFHTSGFHYGRDFNDLAAVLAYGVAEHARFIALSDARDAEFMRSTRPFDQRNQVAAAARSWLADSRRLAGEPPLDLSPLAAWRG